MRLRESPLTGGFAVGIKAGGDPRGLPDYQRLCAEMARLGHPACPDVDWHCIEQCCLALFASNGADLQTAAAYALARSHLTGLDGMVEGMMRLEMLLRADARPWPRGMSARAQILGALFGSWQAVLRELEINPCNLAGLGVLSVQLERLRLVLPGQISVPISSVEGLRRQIAQRVSRIEREALDVVPVALDTGPRSPLHSSSQSCPARIQPTDTLDRPPSKDRRAVWIGLLVAALLSLIAALAWA